MSADGLTNPPWRQRLDEWLALRPDVVLFAPYMAYLALLALRGAVPESLDWVASIVRGVGSLIVVWLVWKHLPRLGKPHWGIVIVAGILSTLLWVAGEHFFREVLGWPARLPLPLFSGQPDPPEQINPFNKFDAAWLAWTTIVTRIAVAITAVPIVEELFWRGFLLRAFIKWEDFDRVPLGAFTWFSLIGTALLSTVQHPDNWAVSIVLWIGWNALMVWKRSLACLMYTHALTNLLLYVYVVYRGDWIFW